MKRLISECFKVAPLLIALSASGQNLPKAQSTGVYAPATIKIDGKAMEWATYQAYDINNNIYFTLANDDNNLYLVVHSKEKKTINKIFVGGITLTLTVPKSPPVLITYPRPGNNGTYLHTKVTFDDLKKNAVANEKEIKDLIQLKNTEFENSHKELTVKGSADFDDQLLSVYNDKGIKVKALFDDELNYTYELAFPLKYLPGGKNNLSKLRYDIQLNGSYLGDGKFRPPGPVLINAQGEAQPKNMDQLYTETPTNFGGEYILAKKN